MPWRYKENNMKGLKQWLAEAAKQMPWNGHPIIGWWRDASPITMYHGTHKDNLDSILKTGIYSPKSGYTAGWVSLAFDPNTAFGYASMSGGETNFRSAGAKAQSVPPKDRVVLVLQFKNVAELEKIGLGPLRGMMDSTKTKLSDKSTYESWSGDDQSYYALTELRIKDMVPAKYIKGFMFK